MNKNKNQEQVLLEKENIYTTSVEKFSTLVLFSVLFHLKNTTVPPQHYLMEKISTLSVKVQYHFKISILQHCIQHNYEHVKLNFSVKMRTSNLQQRVLKVVLNNIQTNKTVVYGLFSKTVWFMEVIENEKYSKKQLT